MYYTTIPRLDVLISRQIGHSLLIQNNFRQNLCRLSFPYDDSIDEQSLLELGT
ncbi:MAG: hypothetical protein HW386_2082 [Gammaproteobacteria bacterium]|nr:hypothetical protein [Gammaproteobacteria bacterium]